MGLCNLARQTVEIDSELWQRFLKKLVDVYGSAYGSKKRDALNEAIELWLEVRDEESGALAESKKARHSIERRMISPVIQDLLGEEETMIPLGQEHRIVAESLRARLG